MFSFLQVTLNSLNIYELTPSEKISKFLGGFLCSEDAPTSEMCSNVLTELFGYSAEQAKLLLPGVLDVMLTGISTKQLVHYGQLLQSSEYCDQNSRHEL